MKNFLFLDYESTDTRVNTGQVIHCAFAVTDENLKIKEKLELRSRLKPNVYPKYWCFSDVS